MKRKKLLLLLPLILCGMPTLAHDIEVDGIYYMWNNKNKTELRVSYDENGSKYSGNVVIPESVLYNENIYKVTSIGNEAFSGCIGLSSVTIPNTVSRIYNNAFSGCTGLMSITIPNSVSIIKENAFSDCCGLTSIKVEDGNTEYDSRDNCNAIIETKSNSLIVGCMNSTIPYSVTSIGDYAFYGCSGLTSVTIPNSVATIGSNAFYGCTNLSDVTINSNYILSKTYTSSGFLSKMFGGQVKNYTIGDSVKSIGSHAFSCCSGLTSVTIPNSVTSIGESAFYLCTGLERVNISDITSWCKINFNSVVSNPLFYARHLYMDGSEVTELTIPNSVTNIGSCAFYGCTGLTSVTIPNSVASIGRSAFSGCTGLTSVTIPNSVTSIEDYAFNRCSGLTSVTIPNSVMSIGKRAFYSCIGLTRIAIPNTITNIAKEAFSECANLNEVTINSSAVLSMKYDSLGYSLKDIFGNQVKKYTLCDDIKSIVNKTFSGCSALISVNIPNSVTSIGNEAFSGCTALTSLFIPNLIMSIGNAAFYRCDALKNIFVLGGELSSEVIKELPKVAIYYYNNGFADGNCIYILDKTNKTAKFVKTIDEGDVTIPKFLKVKEEGLQKQYNITSIAKESLVGEIQSLTIGENIQSIESGSLESIPIKTIWLTNTPPDGYYNAAGTINIVANDQYTSLNNKYVYPYVSSIFEVDGIKYVPVSPSERTCDAIDCLYNSTPVNIHIGKEVSFKGVSMKVNNILDYICTSNPYIKTLTIDSECDIPYQAFKGCINLETASLTNNGNIGSYAFTNCKNLSALAINNQGNINDYAFSGCENLKTLDINNFGNVGERSFEGCSNLEYVNINNTGSIGRYAFAHLKNLQTINLGNDVTILADGCFSGCDNIKAIDVPDNITSVGNYCFKGCSQLSNVNIGNGVKTLGSYAFSDCSNLNKITLGSSLATIDNYSFQNCSSLTNIEIPDMTNRIGDCVFSGCTGLKGFVIKDSNAGLSFSLSLGNNGSNPFFADCPLEYVYIGRDISYNTTPSYGYSPFYRKSTLRSVTFSDKETEISNYEFYGCSGLKNVIIGNGVTAIGDWAFSGCSSLEYFSFGANVKNIGKEAFSDCTAMTYLESFATTPPSCGSQALDDINKWNCQLYVPETSLSAYQSADQWKDFFFINTSTVDPLIKDMIELRMKSDSLITSYNSNAGSTTSGGTNSGGTVTINVDSLSLAAFTTPPTGLLTSALQLSSNAKATNEGSYEALLDGNQTTYFHTTWFSGKGDAPNEDHYLQIDLQEEVESIALKYGARGSITNYVNPNNITIYATNNVNGNWTQITTATLTYDNNSNDKGLLSIDLGGKYRYIRISVQNSTLSGRTINGHAYWCLGELRIYNLGTGSQEEIDPQENDEKPQVPKEVVENLQNCINAAGTEISTNAATQSTYDALLSAYNTFLGYLNESTDIERVQITPSVDVWFDLQGRRITKPQTSGIYIHNGKKVWVK